MGDRSVLDDLAINELLWSPETGLVAFGQVCDGFDRTSGLWSEHVGVAETTERLAQTVLVPGRPVAITALGTPSHRLRARLSGARSPTLASRWSTCWGAS